MGIMINSARIKAIRVGGNRLKKVMCMDKRIWSSSVKITFVEAGVETVVEYDYGATVSRSTAPAGATFVGWSADPSGANPVASFVATQDAKYYRVIKYVDYTVNSVSYDYREQTKGPYSVDLNKYSTVKIYARAYGTGSRTTIKFYNGTVHSSIWGGDGIVSEQIISAPGAEFYITYQPDKGYWMDGGVIAIGNRGVG